MADVKIFAENVEQGALDDIIRLIEPTAKVLFFMKPKMNIKAAEGSPKWAKRV